MKQWYQVIEVRPWAVVYTGMIEYTDNINQLLKRAAYAFPQYGNLQVIETKEPKQDMYNDIDELPF